jgi:hypothetical protein
MLNMTSWNSSTYNAFDLYPIVGQKNLLTPRMSEEAR